MVTIHTPGERLVWYAAVPSRSAEAIKNLGVMDGYHGVLVRDDYAGWAQFDAQLAGVQQCSQHISRHLKGVHALHPDRQHWAKEARQSWAKPTPRPGRDRRRAHPARPGPAHRLARTLRQRGALG